MDNKYFTSLNGYLVKDTDARNSVNELNTKLNATNTNVSNNKANISTNTKEIAALKTSVTNVNAKADFNTANLETLQASVNVVKIDNDKNKSDLALLNEKVNGIDGINAQLETTIDRVTTNEENITTNTANIQNIQMGLNAVHTHENLATLDMITQEKMALWDKGGLGAGGTGVIFETIINEEVKILELSNLELEDDVDYELTATGKATETAGVYIRINDNSTPNLIYNEGGYQYSDPTGHLGTYTHSTACYIGENGFHIATRMTPLGEGRLRLRFRKVKDSSLIATWENISPVDNKAPIYGHGFGVAPITDSIHTIFLILTGNSKWTLGSKITIRKVG